jgi:hypothetical protein
MKKTLITTALVLIAVMALTACAGAAPAADESNLSPATMTIVGKNGKETAVTIDTLKGMDIAEFTTEQGTSKSGPVKDTHKGVLLNMLFEKLGFDTSALSGIKVTASDGFEKVYSREQLDDPEKLFLTYEQNGKTLSDADNKQATFFVIAKNEQFKNNWTKYVSKITLQ